MNRNPRLSYQIRGELVSHTITCEGLDMRIKCLGTPEGFMLGRSCKASQVVIRADPGLEGSEGYTVGWPFNKKNLNPVILTKQQMSM